LKSKFGEAQANEHKAAFQHSGNYGDIANGAVDEDNQNESVWIDLFLSLCESAYANK
jgi:hypothetical protein